MRSRYEKEFHDLLQTLRDKEDENAQKLKKMDKAKTTRLRDINRLLQTSISCLEAGIPRSVIVAAWRNSPELKPIADFLFPKSK